MKKILIVDDTPSNIDILVGYLGDDYELLIALNGFQALSIIQEDIPDLILLDIRMPGMDGFTVCNEMKKNVQVAKIPVIFLTAETDEESIQNAFASGGVDYIRKPIILQELKARIQTHLNLFSYTHDLETIVKQKTDELKSYLYKDKITSLKNSFSLQEDIKNFIGGTFFVLDINNFNTYNKLHGFLYGNKVLKATAKQLQNFISQDNNYSLYKLSVDRFVIIYNTYDEELIESFCLRLFSYFDSLTLEIDTMDNFVNFCIGVSKIDTYEKTILEAEYALDYAKIQSSRSYILYKQNSMFIKEEYEHISSLRRVRNLIFDKKIIPFFQPIVDVQTQEIVKYEALARIQDGDEILTPNRFLNSAQRLGMLANVTKDMIMRSFEFFANSNIKFSINLTQRDILDDTMLDFIVKNGLENSINLSNVTFEILENLTLSSDDVKIRNMLTALKQLGCEIAIDDFGSENSNFSRLLSLQSDFIKIDGLFIKDCDREPEKQMIIKAIVNLAKAFDMKTVAEFVSSKEIFETIKGLGIDYAQGYYFGKPQRNIL